MPEVLSEEWLHGAVEQLVHLVEIAGVVIILVGAAAGFARFCVIAVVRRDPRKFVSVRLSLGRYLALALEFQLASDLIHSAIAPSFEQIGKLAAIATIRTALNFFLAREIEEERRRLEGETDGPAQASSSG